MGFKCNHSETVDAWACVIVCNPSEMESLGSCVQPLLKRVVLRLLKTCLKWGLHGLACNAFLNRQCMQFQAIPQKWGFTGVAHNSANVGVVGLVRIVYSPFLNGMAQDLSPSPLGNEVCLWAACIPY